MFASDLANAKASAKDSSRWLGTAGGTCQWRVDVAIELCISCMKWQVFMDGNKRTSIIYANHYLISKGGGLLVVPEALVSEFRSILIEHYEGNGTAKLKSFMRESCWRSPEV